MESNLIASKNFNLIQNKALNSFGINNFNQSLKTRNLIFCLHLCLINEYCVLISYNSTECKLYNIIQYQHMIDSPTTNLYWNAFDKLMIGLQNYWPIINENVDDRVGVANMYGGVNVSFTNDRFNNSNSAIDFKSGYYKIPTGEYVCGDFTFSIWAFIPNQVTYWNRFIDIGNGVNSDNIAIAYSRSNGNYKVNVNIYNTDIGTGQTISPNHITFNTWDHYAFTLTSNVGRLYINGNLVASSIQYLPRCLNRTSNYIGKSNWSPDYNANAIYDEIRLYNRALDLVEIQNIMKL